MLSPEQGMIFFNIFFLNSHILYHSESGVLFVRNKKQASSIPK